MSVSSVFFEKKKGRTSPALFDLCVEASLARQSERRGIYTGSSSPFALPVVEL